MRFIPLTIVALAACTLAATAPDRVPPRDDQILELLSNRATAPPLLRDADGDGYWSVMDCNDDDARTHPYAVEERNALDDDCDGVVDDGFDTSADWLEVRFVKMLWPDHKARLPLEWVSLDATPRVFWTGDRYLALWSDRGGRIRLARVSDDGNLLDESPLYLREAARVPDAAWTGSRLGIVYEDLSGPPTSVRLMTVDASGNVVNDTLVAPGARDPKIAWGQDRFGVVWRADACTGDCLRFQRFDREGLILGGTEVLPDSGYRPAIAFSGTAIELDATRLDRHDGAFGIVYEAYYGFAATSDVLLTVRPLDPYAPSTTVRVNEHDIPVSRVGARPAVAGQPAGFTVCWHTLLEGIDAARARSFAVDTLEAVQELALDHDAGRASRMAWTGSEYVMVNDNMVENPPGLHVHLRRLDPSGNSHLSGGWGPWREANLSDLTPGNVSANPDLAGTGSAFGVIWVEKEEGVDRFGRIWFARVESR